MTEKNDWQKCFFIKGEGVELTATQVFHSSSAKKKYPSKRGTIVIATIKAGKVVPGETLEVVSFNPDCPGPRDKVVRIEINHQPREYACPGDQVGICLQNVSSKDLLPFLGVQA